MLKTAALREVPVPITAGAAAIERSTMLAKAYSGLLADPGIEKAAKLAGHIAIAEAASAASVEG